MSSTNRGAIRNAQDAYMTPRWCVDLIAERVQDLNCFDTFLEPCRGTGSISDHPHFQRAVPFWAELSEGVDYLDPAFSTAADLIVTNPPFSLALEFLTKSLAQPASVAYLLRVNFLGSQKRKEFWQANPLSHLYVLSRRPSFTGHGTDSTEYAWFVWDRRSFFNDAPGVYVL